MASEVIVKADKIKNRKRNAKIVRKALFVLLIFLVLLYIVLDIIYTQGKFTITLDSNETLESGLVIYESLNNSHGKRKLEATPIRFMDNISYRWIPENVNREADGSHNGQNYIAYSFYVENQGNEVLNYHYEMYLDDVIKNVDEAIRIRIYHNDDEVTYAKSNPMNGQPEYNTEPFKKIKGDDGIIISEKIANFEPGALDRMTILIWLEGDDPDCTDALLGGELKMHMVITEEHIDQG